MFAVLHISDFALHAVLRTEPAVSGQPAALFDSTRKKSLVLAATADARASGVELGMTAPQAVARCPALLIRTSHPSAEAEARSALIAIAYTLSPLVEDTAPGVCTIDLKGVSQDFESLAVAAVTRLAEFGLPATAGIASTPLLALYAARAADATQTDSACNKGGVRCRHLIDRTASALKADGDMGLHLQPQRSNSKRRNRTHSSCASEPASRVLRIANEKDFLAPLPIAAADPTPEMTAILTSWGLRTLGQVTALSRDDIGRRLRAEGLAFWDRANGDASRPLHPVALPPTFSATLEFENEIEMLEPLLFVLRRFLDRLTVELRTSSHVAAELELTLRLTDETRHGRSFRLPEPTADVEILFRTLHTHLESLHTPATIRGVDLHITPARPLVRQQGLFETGLRDPHGFAETLARVVALVGSDRVGTPFLEDTHRPDAISLRPPAVIVPAPAPPPLHPPLGLTLRRFRPPLRAQLELTDGRPTYLWTDRVAGAIQHVHGPWQSSGDWWQLDRAWQRTEYDVALADGGIYRLLSIDQAWFIEGEYD
jgi:protein ImuB